MMLFLLPVVAVVIAYVEYPEETKDTLYVIGHTTIRAAFYLKQKACPQQPRRKMTRPQPSAAAELLSESLRPITEPETKEE